MDQEQFVRRLCVVCSRTGKSILKDLGDAPPAGAPPGWVRRSSWFRSLDESGREAAASVVSYSIYSIVFGLLCELDGVGYDVSGTPEKGMYQLRYVHGDVNVQLGGCISGEGLDELHEMYSCRCEHVFE